MTLYSSETDNSSAAIKIKSQTTSVSDIEEVRPYKFEHTHIRFTAKEMGPEENIISEETEKKFYKKAFETKDL
jgi:hypothetical protein